jgi:hypothetical protein
MDRTYNKAELQHLNTKYGSGWIRIPETKEKELVLYPTGDATISGRIYIALPKNITDADKIKYNII